MIVRDFGAVLMGVMLTVMVIDYGHRYLEEKKEKSEIRVCVNYFASSNVNDLRLTLLINDFIFASCSDGAVILKVTSQGSEIDTANISDASHLVRFADQYTTGGGNADEVIAIDGLLSTDLAFVQMVDNGTNATTVVSAACMLDSLTVTFSADPGADAIINYQILRAAV